MDKYTKGISDLLKSKTLKQSGITLFGTFLTGILGLAFFILVAKHLGPVNYGIFYICVVTITLLSNVADVGTNTGIVRFAASFYNTDKEKALKFFKLAFKVKITTFLLVFVLGWIFMPFIVKFILNKPELLLPLRLSLFGIGGSLLFSFTTYGLQAIQKYWLWSGINIFSNLFRLIVIVFFVIVNVISLNSVVFVYLAFPFLGFLVGAVFLPNFYKVKDEMSISNEFFKYNKWVAVFTIITAFSSRLDTYINVRMLSDNDIGVYSVAKSLSDIVPQVVFALAVVVAPKLSGFNKNKQKAISYLKKLQILVLVLAIIGVFVSIPFAYFFIPLAYGDDFINSFLPFAVLMVSQGIFLISVPAHTAVMYFFVYPKLIFVMAVINLLLIGFGGSLMIGLYGIIGASIIVLVGSIVNYVIPSVWCLKKFKSMNNE